MSIYHLYTDGGARGNPGAAATGAVLTDSASRPLAQSSTYLGHTTNNIAEYKAFLEGLTLALSHHPTQLICHSDSLLLVNQVTGRWRVKEPHLKPLVAHAQKILLAHPEITLKHIPREKNHAPDQLVNQTLDTHTKKH